MSGLLFWIAFAVVARLGWGDFQRRGGSAQPLPIIIIHASVVGVFASFAGIGFYVVVQ